MKISTIITIEYTIDDAQIEEFRFRVLQYIQEEIDANCGLTIDDISKETAEEFLKKSLPDIIEDVKKGYACNSGIDYDDYFRTISFDYCGEDIYDLVVKMAEEITNNK